MSELINQRGRRPVHIAGGMLPVINPSRYLFGIPPFGDVAFWLGSVLI
jgi:hypothetical protein